MTFINGFLNIFFPPRCSFCKREGAFLCLACREQLELKKIAGRSTSPSSVDFEYLNGVIYALDYAKNPAIKAAITQFKYRYTKDLTEDFGILLSTKVAELSMTRNKKIVLIPVPLHKKRLNERGFNQAQLIAEKIAEKVGEGSMVSPFLHRLRYTSQQAKLNKAQRHRNLKGAFSVQPGVKPDPRAIYFLVDDVCTTGSTLDHCARVLKEAGFDKIYGLVLARAFK